MTVEDIKTVLKESAKFLAAPDNTNTEYNRGMVELIAEIDNYLGLPTDIRAKEIAKELNIQID